MAKSLVSLAKGKSKKTTPEPTVKKVEEKKVVKPITPEEERNIKARETVEKLLQDIPLNPNQKANDELIEIDGEEKQTNPVGSEWLEEQIALLQTENETLKRDYSKIFAENKRLRDGVGISSDSNQDEIKATVIKLFNELQSNYISMGMNQITGAPNFIINPVGFMNRLIMFFPFLANERKF